LNYVVCELVTIIIHVEFEYLTAVRMKTSVFWDKTPYRPFKFNRRFGRTRHHQLQVQRISQVRKEPEAGRAESCYQSSAFYLVVYCLVYSLTLNIEATDSSETSFKFQTATRPYMPKDRNLQLLHVLRFQIWRAFV
jgi:hypothetical protein